MDFGPLLWLFAVQFLLSILSVFLTETSALAQIAAMVEPIGQLSIPILFFLTVGAQVYRYVKVSGAVEREQTKWFLLGLVLAFVPLLLLFLVVDTASMLGTIAFTALPIGIGISILRYRLWDVDVIIRKTLVYTVVTALLALVYFGSVVLLQRLFGVLTGVEQSPLAVVVSTLAIAALFTPLRRRIQDWIDRRFFRKKYNAQQVLAQFALTARDETDLDALTAELVRVVQETMQPEQVSVWLKDWERQRHDKHGWPQSIGQSIGASSGLGRRAAVPCWYGRQNLDGSPVRAGHLLARSDACRRIWRIRSGGRCVGGQAAREPGQLDHGSDWADDRALSRCRDLRGLRHDQARQP